MLSKGQLPEAPKNLSGLLHYCSNDVFVLLTTKEAVRTRRPPHDVQMC